MAALAHLQLEWYRYKNSSIPYMQRLLNDDHKKRKGEMNNLNTELREAFNKKKIKKLKFFNSGLTPPLFSGKVEIFFFHFFLRLDQYWGTFGKNYIFPP